jgi:DNA-binding transcriptional ArsR family regulator
MVEHLVPRPATLRAVATFAALGHPVRCAIVDALRDRVHAGTASESRVTDLARPHAMSLAAVSKHIVVLERAGIVRRRVVGRDHRIALQPGALETARQWLDGNAAAWEGRLDALEDALADASIPAERSA